MSPSRAPKRRLRVARSPYAPGEPATDRQSEFLAVIGELAGELGRAPSAGEIAARMGITRLGARKQLQALARKGILKPAPITTMTGWALC